MTYTGQVTARVGKWMSQGLMSQPIGGLALLVGYLVLGGPEWAGWLLAPFVPCVLAYVVWARARHGAPQPFGFFVTMCTGVALGIFVCGLLRSPMLFALGTLPVGATGLGPSLRFARWIRVWMLSVLAIAIVGDWAEWPIRFAPPFADRETLGPGFYLGSVMAFAVLATGTALGGLAARELRLALDDAEAVAELSRAEHLASLEARTKDVMLLAGSLADELREPLAAVKRRAEVIRARASSDALAERLAVLVAEVDRVEKKLAHHVTFARPSAPAERVFAAELFGALVAVSEGLAASRGVTLAIEGDAQLALETDREKLTEILENLLHNAIEASPAGGRVVLAARSEGDGVALTVTDEGPGLGDTASKLFVPGFTTKAQGSGLGLVLSRSLAEQLGGTLTLTSRSGGGCLARISVPRAIERGSRDRRSPAGVAVG